LLGGSAKTIRKERWAVSYLFFTINMEKRKRGKGGGKGGDLSSPSHINHLTKEEKKKRTKGKEAYLAHGVLLSRGC